MSLTKVNCVIFSFPISSESILTGLRQGVIQKFGGQHIHGCFDEWMSLKSKIEEEDTDAKFILVGDIVDRGKQVVLMLKWAIENITENGKYQMVLGNHELEKIQWFLSNYTMQQGREQSDGKEYTRWISDDYDFQESLMEAGYTDQMLTEAIQWFMGLPLYKDLIVDTGYRKQHYLVVHAAVHSEYFNKDESFRKKLLKGKQYDSLTKEQSDVISELVWRRNFWSYPFLHRTIVIHGHTPTISEQCIYRGAVAGTIFYNSNDINVDCGLVFEYEQSNLAAVRLEDLKEFYLSDLKTPEQSRNAGIQEEERKNLLDRLQNKRKPKSIK